MIKSNILKSKNHIYPPEFTDEDKLEYDRLFADAEKLHADVCITEPWIVRLAIIGHIRANKGLKEPYTNEELEAMKNNYKLTTREFNCDSSNLPYLYDKANNPMFFSNDELLNSNIIVDNETNES